MKTRHCLTLALALLAPPASAAELSVKIEQPTLSVAEYHRPYLAVWLEKTDGSAVTQLAVWYDQNKKDHAGAKWLKDLRQWWRKGGRDLAMPVDGVAGATRAPGVHTLYWNSQKAPLKQLPAGDYQLMVEAAREGGGREVVRVPVSWPGKTPRQTSAQGQQELGTITVQVKP